MSLLLGLSLRQNFRRHFYLVSFLVCLLICIICCIILVGLKDLDGPYFSIHKVPVLFTTEISAVEVSKFAENFRTSCSCVIKTVEPQAHATIDYLKTSVLKVNSLEEQRSISPWDDEHIPEEIVTRRPDLG